MQNMQTVVEKGYISLSNCLIKADAKHSDIIYIEASNELEDSQKETVLQKALVAEKNSFLQKGVISWDHQHKQKKDPNYICGEPLAVAFQGDKTLVKARIYEENKYGQGILSLVKSRSTRLGASIGGFIAKRVQRVDDLTKAIKQYITKVLWDEVAITYKPVNEATLGNVSVMPFEEFAKSYVAADTELYKALMAGVGTDHASFSGGRSLVAESLQGGSKSVVSLEKRLGKVLISIKGGKVKNYQGFDSLLIKHDLVPFRTKLMSAVIKNITNF